MSEKLSLGLESHNDSSTSSPAPAPAVAPSTRPIAFPPEALSDVQLVYEGVEFLCHTQILSVNCKVFCATFDDFHASDERRLVYPPLKNPLGELVTPEDFEHFLKCLYSPGALISNFRLQEPAINGKFSQISVFHCAHYFDCSLLESHFFPSPFSIPENPLNFWSRLLCADYYQRKEDANCLISHAAHAFPYYSGASDSKVKILYEFFYSKISLEARERLQTQRADYLMQWIPKELRTRTVDGMPKLKDRMCWGVGATVDCLDTINKWLEAEIVEVREIGNDSREFKIHYTNWSTRWDEWIHEDSDRLAIFRRNSAGDTKYPWRIRY